MVEASDFKCSILNFQYSMFNENAERWEFFSIFLTGFTARFYVFKSLIFNLQYSIFNENAKRWNLDSIFLLGIIRQYLIGPQSELFFLQVAILLAMMAINSSVSLDTQSNFFMGFINSFLIITFNAVLHSFNSFKITPIL